MAACTFNPARHPSIACGPAVLPTVAAVLPTVAAIAPAVAAAATVGQRLSCVSEAHHDETLARKWNRARRSAVGVVAVTYHVT